MAPPPKTQYARRGDVNIAYQVMGDGPVDLLCAPGFISNVDLYWTEPRVTAYLRRLATFSRLIIFDKPGTGASDPVASVPTLEERVQDMCAVLDAVGSERTAVLGVSEGGPMSLLFAATYPERITRLLLYGSFAKWQAEADYVPEALEADAILKERFEGMLDTWGEGRMIDIFAPTIADSAVLRSAWALFERAAASPGMVRGVWEAARTVDARAVLPTIDVPTLVLHRTGDQVVPAPLGRYMGETIPGARYVELPGDDHTPWFGDSEMVLAEIEEFLTGTRQSAPADRVLATVLFTDIVGSTERAAELGDRRWRELLEGHDEIVRAQLERFGGREVNTTGDGFLAAFEGPARAIECAQAVNDELEGLDVRGARRHPHRGVRAARRGPRRSGCPHRRARGREGAGRRGAGLQHREGAGRRLGDRVRGPRVSGAEGRAGRMASLRRPRSRGAADGPGRRRPGRGPRRARGAPVAYRPGAHRDRQAVAGPEPRGSASRLPPAL